MKTWMGIGLAGLGLIAVAAGPSAMASHEHEENGNQAGKPSFLLPVMNSERGKRLFVSKGCVACHSVNGVGGHDAQPMDAHAEMTAVNPFDFAAKMWNHAPGMIAAQEEAFGDAVTFLGHELADIIAFVHDDVAQHSFTAKDITAKARELMNHEHGEPGGGPATHAEDIGHDHKPDTPPHKD